MKILYTAKATVQGGRKGQAQSSDGHLQVHLSVPKEMGEMVVRAPILSSFLPPGTQPASSQHLSRSRVASTCRRAPRRLRPMWALDQQAKAASDSTSNSISSCLV